MNTFRITAELHGFGKIGLRGIDSEVEKGSEDRVAISLGRLCVVLGQRDKKREDFFSFDSAYEVPMTESRVEMR